VACGVGYAMSEKFTWFPICTKCGRGNLALMPRVQRDDPVRVFCMNCQESYELEKVAYEER